MMTTTDYQRCKDFVTRKAPFDVYDALSPVSEDPPSGRLALYLCVEAKGVTLPGTYSGEVSIREGDRETLIPLSCRVSKALVPPLSSSRLGMLNFFDYDGLANQHHTDKNSRQYWEIFGRYVKAKLYLKTGS